MRYITLSEYLRPWAQLGITHFLSRSGEDPSYSKGEELFVESLPFESTSPKNIGLVPDSDRYTVDLPKVPLDMNRDAQKAQIVSPSIGNRTLPAEKEVDPSYTLPPAWEKQLAKVSKAPVVWSYPELGLDLSGKAVPERSATLKLLIGKLAFPKGTSAFWPMALPDEQEGLSEDKEAYLFGLEKIDPQVVLLLGKNAVSCLSHIVKLNVPFTQQLFEGRLYIFLPDLLSVHSDGVSLEKTLHYLKSVFSTFQVTSR